jgi:hypothetical protein
MHKMLRERRSPLWFILNVLTIGASTWGSLMQRERFVDLLPCAMIRGFLPKFYSQISNSKLKCNCILIVHNDHMYDLTNMGDLLTCTNVSLVNFDGLAHMFIKC